MRQRFTGEIGARGGLVRRTRANSDTANLPRGAQQCTIELEERVVALLSEGKGRAEIVSLTGKCRSHINRTINNLRAEGRI
jgi:hypothetical protein